MYLGKQKIISDVKREYEQKGGGQLGDYYKYKLK